MRLWLLTVGFEYWLPGKQKKQSFWELKPHKHFLWDLSLTPLLWSHLKELWVLDWSRPEPNMVSDASMTPFISHAISQAERCGRAGGQMEKERERERERERPWVSVSVWLCVSAGGGAAYGNPPVIPTGLEGETWRGILEWTVEPVLTLFSGTFRTKKHWFYWKCLRCFTSHLQSCVVGVQWLWSVFADFWRPVMLIWRSHTRFTLIDFLACHTHQWSCDFTFLAKSCSLATFLDLRDTSQNQRMIDDDCIIRNTRYSPFVLAAFKWMQAPAWGCQLFKRRKENQFITTLQLIDSSCSQVTGATHMLLSSSVSVLKVPRLPANSVRNSDCVPTTEREKLFSGSSLFVRHDMGGKTPRETHQESGARELLQRPKSIANSQQ